MTAKSRTEVKMTEVYDQNIPGRKRTVKESDVKRWTDAGWGKNPPAPSAEDNKTESGK